MNKIWVLKSLESTRGYGKPVDLVYDAINFEQKTCSINSDHQRPGKRIGNLSVIIRNKPVADILWTWTNDCLLQDKVYNLLKNEGITGFDVQNVVAQIDNKLEIERPILHELIVKGQAGDAKKESGVNLIDYCSNCGASEFSAPSDIENLIDEDQWDGQDMFIVWPMPKYIFVTQKVVTLIKKAKINGCRLIPINKLSFKFDGLSPGDPPPNFQHQRFKYNENGFIRVR